MFYLSFEDKKITKHHVWCNDACVGVRYSQHIGISSISFPPAKSESLLLAEKKNCMKVKSQPTTVYNPHGSVRSTAGASMVMGAVKKTHMWVLKAGASARFVPREGK